MKYKKYLDNLNHKHKALASKLLADTNKSMLGIALIVSCLLSLIINSNRPKETDGVPEFLYENLEVFLPDDHVLFPVEAENFDSLDSLLGAKAFVKVFSSSTNKLIAENIKVLRAPKAPDQLAFVIPVNIAKKLVQKGPIFKLIIQKSTKQKAKMTNSPQLNKKTLTTYGS